MKSAPYIFKGGKWVDANIGLDIRDNDSASSPTSKNVPKVFAHQGGKFNQIYPPLETEGGSTEVTAGKLKNWRGGKWDLTNGTTVNWGWEYVDSRKASWTAAIGYFGTGSYDWETNVKKEYAGWLGITRSSLKKNGYKGLGSVTKVSKFTLKVQHLDGTGYPAHKRKFAVVATKVADPYASRVGDADINNPCYKENRSEIIWSDNKAGFETGGWATFTFSNASAVAMMKAFLNGNNGWFNLCSYNGEHSGNAEVFDSKDQGGRLLYMTKSYMKIKAVKISVDYKYEP